MKDENDKLKKLNSVNVTFQRDVTVKLDEDLQSVTIIRNELQQKLRKSNFQKNLDREEYERLLQIADQCNVAVRNEEEDNSFSLRYRQNDSNPNYRSESNPGTGLQLAK